MKIRLKMSNSHERVLKISNSLAEIIDKNRVILHFGLWKRELAVRVDSALPKDTISIQKKLLDSFSMPDHLLYELKVEGINLNIGPIIGFVPVVRKELLHERNLERYKEYMKNYSDINGLVYMFAANSVNFENQTIDGFYYDPIDDMWKEGVFPFPNAIYRKTGFSQSILDGLTTTLGDRIFNSYFFDKWELWNCLSTTPHISKYLPYTEKLQTIDQVDKMLEKYGSVYLKQRAGQKAKGIVKLHKSEEGYHFVYRLRGEKIINNNNEAEKFIKELNIKKNYVVQQAIAVKQYDERNFDFRVILQKDNTKEWKCPGIIGRFGKKGSIATNFLLDGFSLNGIESLKKAFNLNKRKAFVKEQEIIRVCKEACDLLNEKMGQYGDLGIDVMIDENLKVWILEINKLHDHKFPLYGLDDTQMYYKVISNPILFAKRLGGF
ncbi:YheC/YheD family protein [Mycoplasmatota bacterium WC44]